MIQSKRTILGKSVFDDIHWALESGALILHPDFNELKRSDYNGFSSAGKTTRKDGNPLRVFFLSVVGEESTPRSVRSNCPNISSHMQLNADGRHNVHLTARLGASSIRGGKMPLYKRPGLKLPCCEHHKKIDELTPHVRQCF